MYFLQYDKHINNFNNALFKELKYVLNDKDNTPVEKKHLFIQNIIFYHLYSI